MPQISVIVPIYNSEKYLERSLSKLQKQTFKEIEFILINDGSEDTSLDICNKYVEMDNRFKVYNQDNKGVSVARNLGIQLSNSEYIAFLDPDDDVDIYMYEKLLSNMKTFDADVSFCNYYEIKRGKCKNPILLNYKSGVYGKDIIEEMILNMIGNKSIDGRILMGAVWRSVFKKELILKYNISFPINIRPMQDLIFMLDYLTYCNSIYIDESILYFYHINPDSAVNSYNRNMWNNHKKVFELIEYILIKSNLLSKCQDRLQSRYFSSLKWCILNESHRGNSSTFIEKVNNIRLFNIYSENIMKNIYYSRKNLSFSQKIILYCIINDYAIILYFLGWIKNRACKVDLNI